MKYINDRVYLRVFKIRTSVLSNIFRIQTKIPKEIGLQSNKKQKGFPFCFLLDQTFVFF